MIYACLRRLVELGGRHIITIEDPVEQIVPGLMQTEVNEARGLTFAKAARHLLRQDPQVLVIGEVRDDETAEIVVRAALTGHLVISTLHAGSCQGVIERLQMMCADSYAVASSMELILTQRLMRRVCGQCQGARCDACLQTGYHGRVPVLEWLRPNVLPASRRAGASEKEQSDIFERGTRRDAGGTLSPPQPSIRDAARELVKSGLTDAAEFERIFSR